MDSRGSAPNLPLNFLCALVADSGAEEPPARIAAEQARSMEEGREQRELLEVLLHGPYDDSAPLWLLEAAVESDLSRKPPQSDPLYGPSMDLALPALSHPSCTPDLRHESLGRCTAAQLGRLGSSQASDILADAIVEALRERVPHPAGMTIDLLDTPTDAQLVLRQHRLHNTVITAALDLLPSYPVLDEKGEEEDTSAWLERQRAAERAWRTMWRQIVTAHPEHHRLIVEWSDNNDAGYAVRELLLGGIPWDVEPELLEEIAQDDLASFPLSVLATRMCRMRRDGATQQEVREHFADDLGELLPRQRKSIDWLLSEDKFGLRYGCRAAISDTARAADGRWRYILNPDQAQQYVRPHTWRASEDLLAHLAQKFAEHAAVALELWEPDPEVPLRSAEDLRWVRDLLRHLPVVTPEVQEKARLICREARRGLAERRGYGRYGLDSDEQQARELLNTIERMTAEPLPGPGPARTASLGKPDQITVQDIASAPDAVLDAYLQRHQGNNVLVEKALLSFASRPYHRGLTFTDVLKSHSDPQRALLDLTMSLRRLLGGGPSLREAWVDAVLSVPTTDPELIRALPAWTALKARGPRGQAAHPAVTSVVRSALGDKAEAWQRFATSPASYAGPTAWLRLGDLLDAAANGAAWPAPPHK